MRSAPAWRAVGEVNLLSRAVLGAERAVQLGLEACGRRFSRGPARARHLQVGERGELEAMYFLRRQGYLVVERRWRSPELRGDLDLIAWDGGTLVFVEVKARTKRDFAPARSAVDREKQAMLRRMARGYRRTLPRATRWETPLRFDVVSVYLLGDTVQCELARGVLAMDARVPDEFRM